MSSNCLELKIDNGVALVTLTRAEKHNALNLDMFLAIDDCIRRLKQNKALRAVIVSGKGPSFCSGLDIRSVMQNPKHGLKLLWKWLPGNANLAQRVCIGWRKLDVPVIMAIHGKCWGGGMQIALGGDFRIAAKDSSLAILEAKWGIIPDMGGTVALQELVALDQAKLISITASELTANEALDLNLITQIADDPLHAAKQLASELMERSPDVNRTIKRSYQGIWGSGERKILAKETFGQIKILLGKNQKIAAKRAMGDSKTEYKL